MKRVLQIPNYQYPHIGGIEQVARDVANSLKLHEDIEQKMICFNEDAQDGDYVCHRGQTVHDYVDGIEVVRCGCIAKVASQSLSLTYMSQLRKLLCDFRPNVIIFHYPNPFVASFLLPMLSDKTEFILYWHLDITKQKMLGKLFNKQTLKLLKRADKIVATSPNYIEGSPYLSEYKDKCVVIPNCISEDHLVISDNCGEEVERLKEKYKDKTICLALGRHVEYKGMKYLVEASKYLDDSYVVLIGGSGPLTDELKEQAKGDDKITFLGRIPDEMLAVYYNLADIFCFPSITKNEAFGIALAEAMYFELPTITFTISGSGVNYVNIDGETGIECPNCDSKAFAEAIKKLASDEELREKMGLAAKERVENCFMKSQFDENIKILFDRSGN